MVDLVMTFSALVPPYFVVHPWAKHQSDHEQSPLKEIPHTRLSADHSCNPDSLLCSADILAFALFVMHD